MQIQEFWVNGLFDTFCHRIPLGPRTPDSTGPSVTIIHGPNGIGKTTILRMMSGFMTLDFDIFRRVPFESAGLRFNTGEEILVSRQVRPKARWLDVIFGPRNVRLSMKQKGAFSPEDDDEVQALRSTFHQQTETVHFQLFEASATATRRIRSYATRTYVKYDGTQIYAVPDDPTGEPRRSLAEEVRNFINEAQVDYRQFFSTEMVEPMDLILEKLGRPIEDHQAELAALMQRIENIDRARRFIHSAGLGVEQWDSTPLLTRLRHETERSRLAYALPVLGAYVEIMEARTDRQRLIAERLRTFEEVISSFFVNKHILIDARVGFRIVTSLDQELSEEDLSSGERHLLFLLVQALTTRRRGTVLAIDEPELSMHLSWQRHLINALCDCAANAEPQLLFATHSPDVSRNHRDCLIDLSPGEGRAPRC